MVANTKTFSPETLARSWFSGVGAEWIPNMFGALSRHVRSSEKDNNYTGWGRTTATVMRVTKKFAQGGNQ